MDESKKSKTAEPKREPPKSSPEQPTVKEPVFPLGRLREDCFKLFGVTPSTFDGATCGLEGEFTIKELRDKIHAWQNMRVRPASEKGGN